MNMPLTIEHQTATLLTVSWTPPAGVIAYRFFRDGQPISSSWKPDQYLQPDGTAKVSFGLPDQNTHTFAVAAVGALAQGQLTANGTQPPPPPPPQPAGTQWADFWGKQPPPVTITRPTVKVSTQSALLQAIAESPGAELIQYTGGKDLTGEVTVARSGPMSVVDLGGAKFTGAGYELPNFFLKQAGGLRFVNGEIVGGGGDGLRVEDALPGLEFWGFRIHGAAAQGIHVYGATRPCQAPLLHCELWNNGLDLSQDPHAEKGTGLHGFYSGGSKYPVVGGDWTLWVHDQPHGAAMQINRTRGAKIALLAERVTFVAHQQVGGNALQFWAASGEDGSTWNDSITVDYVEADDVARVVETNGMEVGSLANSAVVYGRGSNVRLSPAYATRGGMRYQDVLPKP